MTATQVTYTDTNSIGETTVQGAIDKLYEMASSAGAGGGKDNTVYFAFGDPTDPSISKTTDFKQMPKNVFIALNGGQKSVCFRNNRLLNCFDNNNYAIEVDHMRQIFLGVFKGKCSGTDYYYDCDVGDFECQLTWGGNVDCGDGSSNVSCSVTGVGYAGCLEY